MTNRGILVVGNACADIFIEATEWPGPGMRLVIETIDADNVHPGGNGFSVTAGLAALGREPCLVTAMASDFGDGLAKFLKARLTDITLGSQIKKLLKRRKKQGGPGAVTIVNLTPHDSSDEREAITGRSYIVNYRPQPQGVSDGGPQVNAPKDETNPINPSFLHLVGAGVFVTPKAMQKAIEAHSKDKRLLVVSLGVLPGLDKRMDELAKVIAFAKERFGLKIIVDTTLVANDDAKRLLPSLLKVLRSADVFVPNRDELCQWFATRATAKNSQQDSLVAIAQKVATEVRHDLDLVVKCGAQGCRPFRLLKSGDIDNNDHVEANQSVQVRDTTGAGDSWLAGFVDSIVDTWPSSDSNQRLGWKDLVDACRHGNEIAALCIQQQGTTGYITK